MILFSLLLLLIISQFSSVRSLVHYEMDKLIEHTEH